MIQYTTLILKLLNSQHNKLKSGIKNSTEATLNLPSNQTYFNSNISNKNRSIKKKNN